MADEPEVQPGAEAPAAPSKDAAGAFGDFASGKPAAPAVDRTKLESKVSKNLAAAFGGDVEESTELADEPVDAAVADEAPAETDDKLVETGDAPDPVLPGDETDDEEELPEVDKEQSPKPGAKPAAPASTFPAALRRTLQAYGWSDDEIDASHKANPAQFIDTASRLHVNRSKEIASWAAIGRQAREQNKPAADAPKAKETAEASPHVDAKTGLLKPLDVDGMIERHGNEDFVREVTAPVNAVIEQINKLLPELQNGVQSIQQSKRDTAAKQIDQFFGAEEMKPYGELYGPDSANLSDEQLEKRNSVLELADALIYGSAQQGTKLSAADALKLAHDSVSSGHKAQAARKDIKAKVKARGASLTLRPSKVASDKGATPGSGGKSKSRAQLEAATRQRLASVFGS